MAQTTQRSAPPRSAAKRKDARSSGATTGERARSTVGDAIGMAKLPLVGGGAALAGAAGGMVLGARRARSRGPIARALGGMPRVEVSSKDVAKAAAQVGQLASELQRAREASNGDQRRSPIEVVLQGLTSRRAGL
jgi:hypothetical protein